MGAVSKEEQRELPMVDLVYEMLKTEKQPLPLQEIIERIKEAKPMPEDELEEHIARFYTNLNLDGRFMFIGENHWGLKNWYPFDQTKEDIEIPEPKRKRKKKKAKKEEDYNDSYDEEEEDYEDEDYDEEDYEEDDQDYEESDDEDEEED